MNRIYQTHLASMVDWNLKAGEIKIPKKVLNIFTPNAIDDFVGNTKIIENLSIISNEDDDVLMSRQCCETLGLDLDIDVVRISKIIDDKQKVCMKTCDAVEDESLEENTLIVPEVILGQNFKPDYVCGSPVFCDSIKYNSINIETTDKTTARASSDIAELFVLKTTPENQLCFCIKEDK